MKKYILFISAFLIIFFLSCSLEQEFVNTDTEDTILNSNATDAARSMPYPLEVDIEWLKFNYTSGNSNDALTLKTDNSHYVPVPEYKPSTSTNKPFCYTANQSGRKVKIRLYHNQSNPHGGYIDVFAYNVYGGLGYLQGRINISSWSYYGEGLLTMSGTTPSSIGKRTQKWQWSFNANFTNWGQDSYSGGNTTHNYYTVLSNPISPMNEPWIEVLDYACDWAESSSSHYNAVKNITKGAYSGLRYGNGQYQKMYDPVIHYNGNNFTYNLTGFLLSPYGSCFDMAAVVQLFSNAVGVNTKIREINGTFWTKSIRVFGPNSSWKTMKWGQHHVAWYNSRVFDSCIKLKNSSGAARIAVNEEINGSYKTDLYSSGAFTPVSVFRYTSVE